VDAPSGVELDGNVDMERDGDNEEEEDEEEEDEEEDDEEEEDEEEEDDEDKDEKEEDEDDDQDEDEDDGKEPRTIGQGELVNTSADDVDTMADDQPIVLPAQGQEMRENTPWPQPPGPAPGPQTPEPRPQPRTAETHPLRGWEFLWLVTLQTSPSGANSARS